VSRGHSYVRSPCEICGRKVTNSGRGYVSHLRAHVRRGEAKEIRVYYAKHDYGFRYEATGTAVKVEQ